jgi:hypothetical protein
MLTGPKNNTNVLLEVGLARLLFSKAKNQERKLYALHQSKADYSSQHRAAVSSLEHNSTYMAFVYHQQHQMPLFFDMYASHRRWD